ncbi:MAG TPA: hypothetical protein VF915_07940 [Reyranella sp.]
MARLDWTTFLAAHPKGHLVAGHVPEPSPTGLKRLRRLMQALIEGQAPAGDYATAIVRRRDITEIQCGFANRDDAERVGARLGARSVPPSDEWLSERSLRLDQRAEVALEDMAAGPKRASRHGLPDRALGRV